MAKIPLPQRGQPLDVTYIYQLTNAINDLSNQFSSVSSNYSKAYLRHLMKSKEFLGYTIASVHNLSFYLWLVGQAREHIIAGDFISWKNEMIPRLKNKC